MRKRDRVALWTSAGSTQSRPVLLWAAQLICDLGRRGRVPSASVNLSPGAEYFGQLDSEALFCSWWCNILSCSRTEFWYTYVKVGSIQIGPKPASSTFGNLIYSESMRTRTHFILCPLIRCSPRAASALGKCSTELLKPSDFYPRPVVL